MQCMSTNASSVAMKMVAIVALVRVLLDMLCTQLSLGHCQYASVCHICGPARDRPGREQPWPWGARNMF
jgi:hypothetical protein